MKHFKIYKLCLVLLTTHFSLLSFAQDMNALILKLKSKLELVKDYEADGKMKTDVSFIKAPIGKVKIFFKSPNKFRIKKEGGISLLPKGGVSVNMNSLIASNDFLSFAAGDAILNGTNCKVVKLMPSNETSDIVLTTLYIDEPNVLIKKAITTTKENGTYEVEMNYGAYSKYGLPDKMIFSFNTRNYKLPKGITLEFDDNEKELPEAQKLKNRKGKIEILYSNYSINKGIPETVFTK